MADVTILCPVCRKPNRRTMETIRRAHFCQHCGRDIVLNNAGPSYYITKVIKEGGQGAVYQAVDRANTVYAVKEMLDRFTDPRERAESTTRFQAEAALLQRLSHPRVPQVFNNFEDEGRHYLVMEFIYGEDLEQVLEREGALSEARALEIFGQICDVLAYLHTQNPPIIFRDMKPSNVMIERDGGVKIIDFGIAKLFQRAERGTQIGTPGYAPPEQYQGLATIESDVYALAATLHHMLTGRDPRDEPPFSFPPVRQLAPNVSERTADAVACALQMDPDDRFNTVAEFRAALLPPAVQPQAQPAPQPTPLPTWASQPASPPKPVRPSQPAAPSVQPVQPNQPAIFSARPAPAPAVPLPGPKPQTSQAQPARRGVGGCIAGLFRALVMIVVVAALIGGAVWFFAPELVSTYIPTNTPAVTPTSAPALVTQQFSVDNLEVTVAADATDQQIREAFVAAFTSAAQAKFGPSARVNTTTFAYAGGLPTKTSTTADGKAVYQAGAQAFIQAP